MINIINEIVSMLNTESQKEKYKFLIISLNNNIEYFLQEINYEPAKIQHVIFRDDSIDELKEKQETLIQNPEKSIIEGVNKYYNIMHDFLNCYHFGFLKDFYLTGSGHFNCKIPVLISKPTFTSTPQSDKVNFEEQLLLLQRNGVFITRGKNNEIKIEATEQNISSIKNLLKKLNATHIEIDLREEKETLYIRDISFWTTPEALDSFNDKRPSFKFEVSQKLNADEIQTIYKLLKDIAHAKSSVNIEGISNVCGNLICSYFSQICEILNIETTISKKQKAEYSLAREENNKKRQIKEEIAKNISPEQLKDSAKKIYSTIDTLLTKNLNFHCDSVEFGPYVIVVKAKCISGYWLDDDILMTDEDFQQKFDCYRSCKRSDYSLVPLNTDKNMNLIKAFLGKTFSDCQLQGFQINSKTEDYTTNRYQYINEVEFNFSNLNFMKELNN